MPYIIRNEAGEIVNATTQEIYGAEMVPYDHPDLLSFLMKNGQDPQDIVDSLNELRSSDAAMARAVEDVINALLKKSILKMIDLPKPVQNKMTQRIKLRLDIENTLHKATDNRANDAFAESANTPQHDPYNS